jgi:hypothetical protein
LVGKFLFNSDAKQLFMHTQPGEINKPWMTTNITAFHSISYNQLTGTATLHENLRILFVTSSQI